MLLQQLMQRYCGEEGAVSAEPTRKAGRWGLTAEARGRPRGPAPVTTDPAVDLNDEQCRVCSQGVRARAAHHPLRIFSVGCT